MAMASLTNAKHEAFARAVASGEAASDAYRQHVGKGSAKAESVWMAASRLRQNDKVEMRIRELRESLDDSADWAMGKRELMAFLARAIRTPLSAIDMQSDLCQEAIQTDGSVRIKSISKLDACDKLAKLHGWYSEDKAKQTEADALSKLLATVQGWSHR